MVIPIAGMILTFILCYELITMVIEKNNMHEQGFFQKYKTELIIAGVTVAAVVGGVLIAKNWDSIVGLAKNWNAPKKPVALEKSCKRYEREKRNYRFSHQHHPTHRGNNRRLQSYSQFANRLQGIA